MKDVIKVLFVCTGNIFRSLSADACLKDYLKKNNIQNISVSSAGTVANKEHIHPTVLAVLKSHGIIVKEHVQRKLDEEILEQNDVIIVMATYHQDFIKKIFGVNTLLFNEIAIGKQTSVDDVDDVLPPLASEKEENDHIIKIVNHIHKHIPEIVKYVFLIKKNKKNKLVHPEFSILENKIV